MVTCLRKTPTAEERAGATLRRGRGVAFLLLLFALASAGRVHGAMAFGSGRDPDLGITVVQELPWAESNSAYVPVQLVFSNHTQKTYAIGLTAQIRGGVESVAHLRFELPPGGRRVELPLLRPGRYGRVDYVISVDGSPSERLSFEGAHFGYANELAVVHVGRGRERLAGTLASSGASSTGRLEVEHLPTPAERLPRTWLAYAGLQGVVVLDAASRIEPAQRRALADWVRFGGGALWIYADDTDAARDAAEGMGLTPGARVVSVPGSPTVGLDCLTGTVLATDIDALDTIGVAGVGSLHRVRRTGVSDLLRVHQGEDHYGRYHSNVPNALRSLLEGLHRVPATGFCFLSVTLAILIGPVNLLVLRRRRRLALFYVTAPLLAGAGMLLLAGYSLVAEGLGVKVHERALLLHDLGSGDGMAYRARGIYAGFLGGELAFPAETAALPFRSERERQSIRLEEDWSRGHALLAGFVPSRTPAGLFTATPVRVRMGLRVERDPDGQPVRIHNELSHAVTRAWVRIVDGAGRPRLAAAGPIAPGESAPVGTGPATSEWNNEGALFHFSMLEWEVIATVEGLPYLEDGGLGGRRLSADYLYVGIRRPESTERPESEERLESAGRPEMPEGETW